MKQNPRRAFNADGTEIQPATVGSQRKNGAHRAEVWCSACHYHAKVSTKGMPDELPIPDICLRYRCSRCGSKNLTSRPSVHEHYELLYMSTGKNYGNASPSDGVKPAGGQRHEDHDRD